MSWKDYFVEDDKKKDTVAVPAAPPTYRNPYPPGAEQHAGVKVVEAPPADVIPQIEGNRYYNTLINETAIAKAPNLAKVIAAAANLSAFIADAATRMKAARATAGVEQSVLNQEI